MAVERISASIILDGQGFLFPTDERGDQTDVDDHD